MNEEKPFLQGCDYNPGLNLCLDDTKGKCEKCGWYPPEHQRRVERLRRGEPAIGERRAEK